MTINHTRRMDAEALAAQFLDRELTNLSVKQTAYLARLARQHSNMISGGHEYRGGWRGWKCIINEDGTGTLSHIITTSTVS